MDGELESEQLLDAASLQPPSRFLKPKSSSRCGGLRVAEEELHCTNRARPGVAYPDRASTLLQKLAEIESKIQSRNARQGTGSSATQQMLVDELSWTKRSQSLEPGAGRLQYLKTGAKSNGTLMPGADPSRNRPLGNRAGLDTWEKDGTGPSLEAASKDRRQNSISHSRPGRKPFQNSQLNVPARTLPSPPIERPSPPGQSSLKRLLHRAPSQPSRDTPVCSGGTSPSLSSSITDNPAEKASPEASGSSVSEGSVTRSLDELFLGAAGSQGSSSSDFQVNILSLADLAPSMAGQKEGFTEEATMMEASGNLSMELEQNLFFAGLQSTSNPSKSPVGEAAAPEEELGGTEISEQLSGSSVEHPSGEQESPPGAWYSEDFDSLSEDTQRPSSSEDSREGLDASLQAGLSAPSSPCLPPAGTKRFQSVRRIPTKEVAVQTDSSSLSPLGMETAAAAATIGWIVEGAPTSSPVVSMDVLEELTTHRPAVTALNDMLKQNLQLIQQFVETSRRLHLSFVALLEEEEFHYHTLEEAKMYIDHHKSPTLTMEQTLQKMEEQKQVAVQMFRTLRKGTAETDGRD